MLKSKYIKYIIYIYLPYPKHTTFHDLTATLQQPPWIRGAVFIGKALVNHLLLGKSLLANWTKLCVRHNTDLFFFTKMCATVYIGKSYNV